MKWKKYPTLPFFVTWDHEGYVDIYPDVKGIKTFAQDRKYYGIPERGVFEVVKITPHGKDYYFVFKDLSPVTEDGEKAIGLHEELFKLVEEEYRIDMDGFKTNDENWKPGKWLI